MLRRRQQASRRQRGYDIEGGEGRARSRVRRGEAQPAAAAATRKNCCSRTQETASSPRACPVSTWLLDRRRSGSITVLKNLHRCVPRSWPTLVEVLIQDADGLRHKLVESRLPRLRERRLAGSTVHLEDLLRRPTVGRGCRRRCPQGAGGLGTERPTLEVPAKSTIRPSLRRNDPRKPGPFVVPGSGLRSGLGQVPGVRRQCNDISLPKKPRLAGLSYRRCHSTTPRAAARSGTAPRRAQPHTRSRPR